VCILTLSLDGGVNVHYSCFIRWFCASLFTVRFFFLLNYVVVSDLIYVLLCLTATSVCAMCLWRWISAVFFMWVRSAWIISYHLHKKEYYEEINTIHAIMLNKGVPAYTHETPTH